MKPLLPGSVEYRVRRAIAAMAEGRPVVLVDEGGRSGELIFAAVKATPQLLAFTVSHTSGYVCVSLPADECDRIDLPPMHQGNDDRLASAYRVSVDLRGTGTGISATARAKTIAALATPEFAAGDFIRPGHVVPICAKQAGVLDRPRPAEAALDLARLAGLPPAGAVCGIVSRAHPSQMADGPELLDFAAEHDLVDLSIAELIEFRKRTEPQVKRVVTTSVPCEQGAFRAVGYRGVHDSQEHVAFVTGTVDDGRDVTVHVHIECLTGDVLRSSACGCRAALDDALRTIAALERGVILYLRPTVAAPTCAVLDHDAQAALGLVTDWILADLRVAAAVEAVDSGSCWIRPNRGRSIEVGNVAVSDRTIAG